MMPVLYNDVLAAVAFVGTLPVSQRGTASEGLIDEAHYAACFARKTGQAHPVLGNGSLMSAALRHGPGAEASFRTRDSVLTWQTVLAALDRHYARCAGDHAAAGQDNLKKDRFHIER